MKAVVASGAGFLLAVLWFDLMFDVQVLRSRAGPIPDAAVESISTYYQRVLFGASPMNRLVPVSMVVMVAGIIGELLGNSTAGSVAWPSLVLGVAPIALAAGRTVPNARRLGARAGDGTARQSWARSVCHDHLFCLVSIASLLILQLIAA